MPKQLPYRPCVGMMLVNRDGLAFIGKRAAGGNEPTANNAWQMPQGGIDEGEEPYECALRELYEETNIRSVELIGEIERLGHVRSSARTRRRRLEGQVLRPAAEMVRAPLHRQGFGDRREKSGGR